MRVKTNLLSTDNNIKNIDRGCNSDEETTSLTSNSSSSDIQPNPHREERRNRRSKGWKNNYATTSNLRRGRKTTNATSTKPHDAPMQKRDMYFALDCEMVGVGPEGLDSALARLSIINWDNELVLDTYVKVMDEVTDYRTFVSGIRQKDIKSNSAMTLERVQYVAATILRGKILIGHGLENDLKVIGINHPWCDIRDTTKYQPYMRQVPVRKGEPPVLRPRKLRDLTWETLGKQIQVMGTAHSPIEDATATMDLYKAARADWEISMMKQVHSVTTSVDNPNKIERPTIMSRFRKVAIEPTARHYYPHTHHNSTQQMKSHLLAQPSGSQYYNSTYIPKLQPIGGTYHQIATQFPTKEERLAAARVAQQQAQFRASAAIRYQTMIQNGLVQVSQ